MHCYDDHRIAMSFAVFSAGLLARQGLQSASSSTPSSTFAAGSSLLPRLDSQPLPARSLPPVVLDDPHCVEKTYPEFWDHLEQVFGVTLQGVDAETKADSDARLVDAVSVSPRALPFIAPSADPYGSIFLIGMRGAGKSGLARAAAAALGWQCVDLDEELQRSAGATVADIVAAEGWLGFRRREAAILEEVAAACPQTTMIACGGGIIETEDARRLLASLGAEHGRRHPIIFLDRAVQDIADDLGLDRCAKPGLQPMPAPSPPSPAPPTPSDSSSLRPAYSTGESFEEVWRRRYSLYVSSSTHHFVVRDGDRDWAAVERDFLHFLRVLGVWPAPLFRAATDRGTAPPPLSTNTEAPESVGGEGVLTPSPESDRDPKLWSSLHPRLHALWDPVSAAMGEGTFFLSLTFPTLLGPRTTSSSSSSSSAASAASATSSALFSPQPSSRTSDLVRDAVVGTDAVELRVDLLDAVKPWNEASEAVGSPEAIRALGCEVSALRRTVGALPIIFTLRSEQEGGKFHSSSQSAASVLELGIRWGVEFLDVETALSVDARLQLFREARSRTVTLAGPRATPSLPQSESASSSPCSSSTPAAEGARVDPSLRTVLGGTRLLASRHFPAAPIPDTSVLAAALVDSVQRSVDPVGWGADVLKLVVRATSLEDALVVRHLRDSLVKSHGDLARPCILLAMGDAGRISRVLNETMTPVTHPSLPFAAAPGQLSVTEIQRLRVDLGVVQARRFFLFGRPIAQSPSPILHNTGFRLLSLPNTYELLETEDVATLGEVAARNDFGGASVTIPLKQTVRDALPERGAVAESPTVRSIGAANTIWATINEAHPSSLTSTPSSSSSSSPSSSSASPLSRLRTLVLENTDWIGILRPLVRALARRAAAHPHLAVSPAGEALILGAGGTSLAAGFALRRLGLSVVVYNRTLERAEAVAAAVGGRAVNSLEEQVVGTGGLEAAVGGNSGALDGAPPRASSRSPSSPTPETGVLSPARNVCIVVSTVPADARMELPHHLFAHQPVVVEAAYRPRVTLLVAQARRFGCEVVEGIDMLVEQGIAQFALWTARTPPRNRMEEAVRGYYDALSARDAAQATMAPSPTAVGHGLAPTSPSSSPLLSASVARMRDLDTQIQRLAHARATLWRQARLEVGSEASASGASISVGGSPQSGGVGVSAVATAPAAAPSLPTSVASLDDLTSAMRSPPVAGCVPDHAIQRLLRDVDFACRAAAVRQASLRVGFVGKLGSFAHEAAVRMYGDQAIQPFALPSASDVVHGVAVGVLDAGVVAIETSRNGIERETLNALRTALLHAPRSHPASLYAHSEGSTACDPALSASDARSIREDSGASLDFIRAVRVVREVTLATELALLGHRLLPGLASVSTVQGTPAALQCLRPASLLKLQPRVALQPVSSAEEAAASLASAPVPGPLGTPSAQATVPDPLSVAVLAPLLAAEVYGLSVLEPPALWRDTTDAPAQRGRFVALELGPTPRSVSESRSPAVHFSSGLVVASDGQSHSTALLVTLPDRPGILRDVLTLFADRGLNLSKIESFIAPLTSSINGDAEYVFFLEVTGHTGDPVMAEALASLRRVAVSAVVVGCFARTTDLA